MVALTDPIEAVVSVLDLADEVNSLTEGRVYAHELAPKIVPRMPLSAITVRRAGGGDRYEPSYIPLGSPRIDVRCYGKTHTAAAAVSTAVEWVLGGLRMVNEGGTRLYSAECEMSGLSMRDPDRDWPFVLSSWRLMTAKVSV